MNNSFSAFISDYATSDAVRLHMPGHKGRFGEISKEDITEIKGADELYEAEGIIAESEKKATEIFGSGATFFSTEGSSQVIKAMCLLAMQYESFGIAETKAGAGKPLIVAGRNAHRAFVSAMELLDFDVEWLWPENEPEKVGDFISLCECRITPSGLRSVLENLRMSGRKAAAVYITSPDYLGNISDIKALAEVAHEFGSILICDNAHGSYLKFIRSDYSGAISENKHKESQDIVPGGINGKMTEVGQNHSEMQKDISVVPRGSLHPIDLGADLVSDSAHKTLPVLTGGAYLHMGKAFAEKMSAYAKSALLRFGSTSPSYLILKSLDEANTFLAEEAEKHLYELTAEKVAGLRKRLEEIGLVFYGNEPLKLTVDLRKSYARKVIERLKNTGNNLSGKNEKIGNCQTLAYDQDERFEKNRILETNDINMQIVKNSGLELAEKLRNKGIEPEYADRDFLVMMWSPFNTDSDFERTEQAFKSIFENTKWTHVNSDQASEMIKIDSKISKNNPDYVVLGESCTAKAGFTSREYCDSMNEKQGDMPNEKECDRPNKRTETVFTPRQVLLMPREKVKVSDSLGRIAAELRLSCPPAVLPVIPGERIDERIIEIMNYYGIDEINVIDVSQRL